MIDRLPEDARRLLEAAWAALPERELDLSVEIGSFLASQDVAGIDIPCEPDVLTEIQDVLASAWAADRSLDGYDVLARRILKAISPFLAGVVRALPGDATNTNEKREKAWGELVDACETAHVRPSYASFSAGWDAALAVVGADRADARLREDREPCSQCFGSGRTGLDGPNTLCYRCGGTGAGRRREDAFLVVAADPHPAPVDFIDEKMQDLRAAWFEKARSSWACTVEDIHPLDAWVGGYLDGIRRLAKSRVAPDLPHDKTARESTQEADTDPGQ